MQNYIIQLLSKFRIPLKYSKHIAYIVNVSILLILKINFLLYNILKQTKFDKLPTLSQAREYLHEYSPIPIGEHDNIYGDKLTFKVDLAIILPAYNAEETIEESVASALNQVTQFKYCIVVINDGSTDSTQEKLQIFSGNHKLIVLNQNNQGFSGSRNRGLDFVKGMAKYVFLLDSDDTLCDDHVIENLMSVAIANDSDIVEGSYIKKYSDHSEYHQLSSIISNNGISSKLADRMIPYPWGKIMKMELWNDVYFPEGFWFEDTILPFLIYPKVKRYASISKYIYNYKINQYGITQTSYGKRKNLDTLYIMEYLIKILSKPLNDQVANAIVSQLTRRMSRIMPLGNEIQKSAFVYIQYLVQNLQLETKQLTNSNRFFLKVIRNGNFVIWKIIVFLRLT